MKIFAFYLPQYHRVPINDKWWGEGFTEWTSARNAKPLYEGHYQPHEPLNDNYYNLLEKETMLWQAKLMHEYGIDGMCFYHYWFSSEEQVLEKPAENLLKWKDVDMPFCFSWANDSWLNKWSHREGFPWIDSKDEKDENLKFIYLQKYGREKEWEKHFEYLLPFFLDNRYIRIDDKPIFVFHNIDNIPCLHEMVEYWQKLAMKKGLKGLYIIGGGKPFVKCNIDAYMTHEPGMIRKNLHRLSNKLPIQFSCKEAWTEILSQKYVKGYKTIYTTFCSYDTTPRYGIDGDVYIDGSPQIFSEELSKLLAKNKAQGIDFCFIDAWNEWGEGMHLEPDKKNGYALLEAVKNAKTKCYDYGKEYRIEGNYIDESEYNLACESKKWRLYTTALERWMVLRENNISICTYFKDNNISNVMIYGIGVLSEHMVYECRKSEIKIKCLLDRSQHYSMGNIPCYKMSNDTPDADAIVVTAIYDIEDICKEIRKFNKTVKIFSLLELICFGEESFNNE